MALGTLISLQQLRLIVGIDVGWRHQWLIDHDVIVAHLRPLHRLKKLALCRDTYEHHGLEEHGFEAYYERKHLWSGEGITYARPELDQETGYFAKAHRRMEGAWEAEMKRQLEILNRFRDQTLRERAAQDANEGLDLGGDHVDNHADQSDNGMQDHQDDTNDTGDNEDNDEDDANEIDDTGAEHDGNQENTDYGDVQNTASDQSEDEDDNKWSEPHDPRYDELSTGKCSCLNASTQANHQQTSSGSSATAISLSARQRDTPALFPSSNGSTSENGQSRSKSPDNGPGGNAVPLSDERDSCRSLLNKWFNLEEIDDD